jgi:hypothetical protein
MWSSAISDRNRSICSSTSVTVAKVPSSAPFLVAEERQRR